MANTVSTQEEANQKWKNQNGSDSPSTPTPTG